MREHLAGAATAIALLTGCQADDADGPAANPSPARSVAQVGIRAVISSADGSCSAGPLEKLSGGRACNLQQTVTYQLGPELGPLDATRVTIEEDLGNRFVLAVLTPASATRLADVTESLISERLAIVVEGAVASAPQIQGRIDSGLVQITPESDDGVTRVAIALDAT